jgi:hypothetical protein
LAKVVLSASAFSAAGSATRKSQSGGSRMPELEETATRQSVCGSGGSMAPTARQRTLYLMVAVAILHRLTSIMLSITNSKRHENFRKT